MKNYINDMSRTGRNEPCPCGSGKKFKKCHGASFQMRVPPDFNPLSDPEVRKRIEQMKGARIQREKQQGLGRPIISFVFKGYRLVAVGNRLHWKKEEKWQAFNDFLSSYIRGLFGQEWADVEMKKNPDDRHPLVQWYGSVCEEQRKAFKNEGEPFYTPLTGAMFAYLTLSYNLYLIAHNIHLVHGEGLHKRLIERLKDKESFYPAFYETMVVASFIKAGFQVQLEDENDSTTQHGEFVAFSTKTKQKYSVEAKHRQIGKQHVAVRNQLYNALRKEIPHKRVIFINLNMPRNVEDEDKGRLKWLDDVLREMRAGEKTITVNGKPAPEAYVFITNHPFLYNLDFCDFPPAVVAEGFKITDFKLDSGFVNLRDALASREKHIDMFDLMRAMREYDQIPCTFSGEIPEYAFGEITETRLKIGEKYLIPDKNGDEVEAELIDCVVSEQEKKVYCMHRFQDGNTYIGTYELSDLELQAYRRHPDTFFGVYKKQENRAKDALDLYDFFYGVYKNTTKEKLLSFLKDHHDIHKFKEMPQEELSKTYCELLVYSAMRQPHSPHSNK